MQEKKSVPMPGDAVRLAEGRCESERLRIVVLAGMVGVVAEEYPTLLISDVFRGLHSSHEGYRVVSAYGVFTGREHVGTPVIAAKNLRSTGKTVVLSCWRWTGNEPGAGKIQQHDVEAPLWEWVECTDLDV